MLLCMAATTADSFGISLMPVSPNGSIMCAIDVQMNMTTPPSIPAKKMRVLMAELQRRKWKLGRKKADFNACPAARGSTFSVFVKLNQSYENISFVVHHRA